MEKMSVNGKIAGAVVNVIFYGGIVCVALVPFLAKVMCGFNNYEGKGVFWALTAMLAISGIAGVYIVYRLKCMFKTLSAGNPFVWENVKSFKKIAIACGIISLIYIIKCVFLFTFGTLLVVVAFGVLGLFCMTLRDLFKQAILYKEENELTV